MGMQSVIQVQKVLEMMLSWKLRANSSVDGTLSNITVSTEKEWRAGIITSATCCISTLHSFYVTHEELESTPAFFYPISHFFTYFISMDLLIFTFSDL